MPRNGATPLRTDTPMQRLSRRSRQLWRRANGEAQPQPQGGSPRLSPLALDGMRLSTQPFTPPLAGHYYRDELRDGQLAEIEQTLLHEGNLVVLSGPPASGKTCALGQLLSTLSARVQLFVHRGGSAQSADRVLRQTLLAFRSATPSALENVVELLEQPLLEQLDTGAISLLVIDDADALDPRELQALLQICDHLNGRVENNLRVLLVSREAAETLLHGVDAACVRDGQIDEFVQPLLSAHQGADYLDARLLMAGSDEALPFNARELEALNAAGGGRPGALESATAQALNQHFGRRRLHAPLRLAHWGAATRQRLPAVALGALMVGGGGVGLLLGGAPAIDPDAVTVRELPIPAIEPPAPTELRLGSAEPITEPITEPTAEATPAAAARDSAVPADAGQSGAAAAANEPAGAPPRRAAEPAPRAAESTATPAAADTATGDRQRPLSPPAASTSVAADAAAVAAPAAATRAPAGAEVPHDTQTPATTAGASTTVAVQRTEPGTGADGGTEPSAAASEEPPLADPADLVAGVISGHQWIARRDPAHFTIQLAAGANDRDLRLQARRHNMTNKAAIYRTLRNGTPWYSLIHGDFQNSAAAQRAIEELPAIWRGNSPWVRPFKSIQQAIE